MFDNRDATIIDVPVTIQYQNITSRINSVVLSKYDHMFLDSNLFPGYYVFLDHEDDPFLQAYMKLLLWL